MDVIKRIKDLTKRRGWSEYRLRKECSLPASTISNIFHRETIPTIATLEIICDALGISLCQFFAEGEFVSLTPQQQELLEKWAKLSDIQRQTLLELMANMNML